MPDCRRRMRQEQSGHFDHSGSLYIKMAGFAIGFEKIQKIFAVVQCTCLSVVAISIHLVMLTDENSVSGYRGNQWKVDTTGDIRQVPTICVKMQNHERNIMQ